MQGLPQRCLLVGANVLASGLMLATVVMLSRYADGHALYVHAVLYMGAWGALCALARALMLLLPVSPSVQRWVCVRTRLWVLLGCYWTAFIFMVLGVRALYEELKMVWCYGLSFDSSAAWCCAAFWAIAVGVLCMSRVMSR